MSLQTTDLQNWAAQHTHTHIPNVPWENAMGSLQCSSLPPYCAAVMEYRSAAPDAVFKRR